MWNDTDIPLAYLITFRCYGTWLHGDKRGSVDRDHHKYKALFAPANQQRYTHNRAMLKGEPVSLDAKRRSSVEKAIREICLIRKWSLHAVSVRTNHVHVVVLEARIRIALNAFKANATRQMRQDGNWEPEFSPWVVKGSKRNLWNERSVAEAINYVVNGQGGDLPNFD